VRIDATFLGNERCSGFPFLHAVREAGIHSKVQCPLKTRSNYTALLRDLEINAGFIFSELRPARKALQWERIGLADSFEGIVMRPTPASAEVND